MSALYSWTSFSYRTLLVTLIVQKWQLKIIAPVVAVSVATGYAIHYATNGVVFLVFRALLQLFSIILIIYCEDKVKWKIMWTNIQQEKWMQVNNFILDNIPENIMILDMKGEAKFISEYCMSFMKKSNLSVDIKNFLKNIRDLQQQHYELNDSPRSPRSPSVIQMERLSTRNGYLLEASEKNTRDLLKFETLEDLIEKFKGLIQRKSLQEKQFFLYNGKLKTDEDFQERSLEVKISFIQHFENDFIILILRDTTQRDHLIALEETNKYKDQLLASVSHELRAPLNGNINLIEGAIDSPLIPQNLKENLLIPALRSSKFLLHIINDILDMCQIKEKKLRLIFQSGDLKETLNSAAQLVELQAQKKGIELLVYLHSHLPKSFNTDHVRLSQIVLNLLNNAIKFTREGTVKLTAIPVERTKWIRITVEDSGIGMNQESVGKLFSSYTQIDFVGRQAMNPNGVGLGLNIAFNLSELLAPRTQGGIRVKSIPNKGSVFSFIVENKEDLEISENQSNYLIEIADELPGDIMTPTLSPKLKLFSSELISPFTTRGLEESKDYVLEMCSCPKVLIVDDNPFNTMAFETILGSLEVKYESVYSGSCCIKRLLKNEEKKCPKDCKQYSVIFMDQEMPEMNGAETVKEIRRLQEENLISSGRKIIGCTAHKSKEEVERFLEAGLDQCIHKPISKVMITDILKDLSVL